MKRILFAACIFLLSLTSIQAQEHKKVESNLMFNSGTFFETGSYYGNINWSELFSSERTFRPSSLLLPGHVFRISYGLDVIMNEHWSLMPGAGVRVQTASLLGMFAIGGDIDVMAAADAFCALRYHLPTRSGNQIIFGLGPDVSRILWQSGYYIDADPRDPRNGLQKFYNYDYGIQPSITLRMGKHWQFGLEANIGLRNMRIPYELEYQHHVPGSCLVDVHTAKVSGTTHLHTVALTCGFHF